MTCPHIPAYIHTYCDAAATLKTHKTHPNGSAHLVSTSLGSLHCLVTRFSSSFMHAAGGAFNRVTLWSGTVDRPLLKPIMDPGI